MGEIGSIQAILKRKGLQRREAQETARARNEAASLDEPQRGTGTGSGNVATGNE